MGWLSNMFGGGKKATSTSSRKRHMIPFHEQSERWQIAAMSYQEARMKAIPGGWSKQDSYPVIDGLRAMTADEIFALVERITTAQSSGGNVVNVVQEIEAELRQIADEATGDRVSPP